QDQKAIEKIDSKLENLIMSNEEVGYIAVQKKPAVTIFPDSVVVTNKRIILCKPKNLGFSMEFIDYDWDDIAGSYVKEGILGSDFTFSTKTDLTHTVDYLPKNQARKLYTYAKEQLDLLKNPIQSTPVVEATIPLNVFEEENKTVDEVEEVIAEEITNFAEIVSTTKSYETYEEPKEDTSATEKGLVDLSQEELFEKLQNYKKLLDNGLILQAEYDALKKEVLSKM
ncbi:MAG: PH domain-containing protein, partial [Flavobacterium sp.]